MHLSAKQLAPPERKRGAGDANFSGLIEHEMEAEPAIRPFPDQN